MKPYRYADIGVSLVTRSHEINNIKWVTFGFVILHLWIPEWTIASNQQSKTKSSSAEERNETYKSSGARLTDGINHLTQDVKDYLVKNLAPSWLSNIVKNPKKGDFYLDAPAGTTFTLSLIPGQTWHDCSLELKKKYCVAWPVSGPKTILKITDQKLLEFYDPIEGYRREQLFYRVSIANYKDTGKTKIGWISAELVTDKVIGSSSLALDNTNSILGIDKNCPPENLNDAGKVATEVKKILAVQKKQEATQLDAILKKVGKCLISKETDFKTILKYYNPCDELIIKKKDVLYEDKKQFPTYNGSKLNNNKLLAIDALARTIYGEMRGCFINGIRYPVTIARIILNRAAFVKKHSKRKWGDAPIFVRNKGARSKSSINEIIPHVVCSPSQFSTWNGNGKKLPTRGSGDKTNLRNVLCLDTQTPKQKLIWKKAVSIASDAVLKPKAFLKLTENIKELHFSSNIKPRWAKAMTQTYPEVGNLKVDKDSCIRLWAGADSKEDYWKGAAFKLPLDPMFTESYSYWYRYLSSIN